MAADAFAREQTVSKLEQAYYERKCRTIERASLVEQDWALVLEFGISIVTMWLRWLASCPAPLLNNGAIVILPELISDICTNNM